METLDMAGLTSLRSFFLWIFVACIAQTPAFAGQGALEQPHQPQPKLELLRELNSADDFSTAAFVDAPSGVTWSSDGAKLAAYTAFGNLVTIWDVDTGKVLQQLRRPGAIAPVGRALAFAAGDTEVVTPPASGRSTSVAFSVFDLRSGEIIHETAGPYPDRARNVNQATLLAASPDETILALTYGLALTQPVALYSMRTWDKLAVLTETSKSDFESPSALAFSRDGKELAVGRVDGVILVYDSETHHVLRVLQNRFPEGGFNWIGFSPDSGRIAVGTAGIATIRYIRGEKHEFFPQVRILDSNDGHPLATYTGPEPLITLRSGAWSPDGRFIVFLANNRLHVWDPGQPDTSGQEIALKNGAVSLAFSPDGTKLAVENGQKVAIFQLTY